MRKTINKKVYNTDTAALIKTRSFSFFGDPAGYEEKLYQTSKGDYFIYGVGGTDSKYPSPDVVAVTSDEAAEF